MPTKNGARRHVARTLEDRFGPLFLLARNPPLPWPARSDEERALIWARLDELDRALERAGLGHPYYRDYRVSKTERAAERKNPFELQSRLAARWDLDRGAATVLPGESTEEKLARYVDDARGHLVAGGWVVRRTGRRLTDGEGRDCGEEVEHIGLLDALAEKKASDPWRRRFLKWMHGNPIFAPVPRARLSIRGRRVTLEPDTRDLHSCIWLLAAELIAGRWPIRKCGAPGCGKYFGQWTKRKRIFCNAGCRTAYHNALRDNRGSENVPGIVPASTLGRPHNSQRQPTSKIKTRR